MPDLPAILDTIRRQPDDERHWLALASWLSHNGREEEAAVVSVFWPTLRDNRAGGQTTGLATDLISWNAERLG